MWGGDPCGRPWGNMIPCPETIRIIVVALAGILSHAQEQDSTGGILSYAQEQDSTSLQIIIFKARFKCT